MTEHPSHDQHHEHPLHEQQHHAEPPDYASWVAEQRRGKDDYFKRSPSSPIPESERAAFKGLHYFPVDESMRFEALELGPLPQGLDEETRVQTSDGAERQGRRVGTFEFIVGGVTLRLVALRLAGAGDDAVFVPFKDATNGSDSYGAGRYLDLPAGDDGTYDLDFNLAYSPFCAYSPSYSCPLPPAENWLKVRIEAGERNA